MLEIFPKKPDRVYCWYAVDANLFQLGSSIHKHTGSRGAAPWGREGGGHKPPVKIKKSTTFFFVLKSSETYARKILHSYTEGKKGSADR